eukprot:XP_003632459.2 PREDICTED: uncharacterized protein LOC100855417 [Vitis vinifera]
MSDRDDDSDAPEEFTSEQGLRQDEEIRKVERENKARVVREGKERRRQWAQRKTPRTSGGDENVQDVIENDTAQESMASGGMLPNNIVELLATREKQVFLSDSEEEKAVEKPSSKRKKSGGNGPDPVILKDIPPPPCLQDALEFLKKKKMHVSRSTSVLNNSNQAFRLLSTSGLLSKK